MRCIGSKSYLHARKHYSRWPDNWESPQRFQYASDCNSAEEGLSNGAYFVNIRYILKTPGRFHMLRPAQVFIPRVYLRYAYGQKWLLIWNRILCSARVPLLEQRRDVRPAYTTKQKIIRRASIS